ncbi:TPA: hypothetical protein PXO92_000847 [Yersinia enterocolitica]|nr:hypothetical protein [Yersinia enterocolitica]
MMNNRIISKKHLLLATLSNYSPKLRDSIMIDGELSTICKIQQDKLIEFGSDNIIFLEKNLFDAIRQLKNRNTSELKDQNNEHWILSIEGDISRIFIKFKKLNNEFNSDEFVLLSLTEAQAIDYASRICDANFTCTNTKYSLLSKLSENDFSDDVIHDFYNNLKNGPIAFCHQFEADINNNINPNINSLIPSNIEYYEKMIGEHISSENIIDYSNFESKKFYSSIFDVLNPFNFFIFLSSILHSSLAEVASDYIPKKHNIYQALSEHTYFSPYIMAAQLEINVLNHEMNHDFDFIVRLEKWLTLPIKYYDLQCALYAFVDGQLSHLKIFNNKPIFYRRLAALTHSVMLSELIIKNNIILDELTQWFYNHRWIHFSCNTLIDMKTDSRWTIDYLENKNFKACLIGRLLISSEKRKSTLPDEWYSFIFSDEIKSLRKNITIEVFLPSPIEGNITPSDIPENFQSIVKKSLDGDGRDNYSFIPIINCAQIWKLNEKDLQVIIDKLSESKKLLNSNASQSEIITVISGVARISSYTQNPQLSKEVIALLRIYKEYIQLDEQFTDLFFCGVIASSGFKDESEWKRYIGEWMQELAFSSISPKTLRVFNQWLQRLCIIEPSLFGYCGKALAALSTFDSE